MAHTRVPLSSQRAVNIVTTFTTITEKLLPQGATDANAPGEALHTNTRALSTFTPLAEEQSAPCEKAFPADGLVVRTTGEVMQALELLDASATGSVLLIEPTSDSLVRSLRAAGFVGEAWAWVRQPQQSQVGADGQHNAFELFDTVFTSDWQDFLSEGNVVESPRPGQFQVIVAQELSRRLDAERIPALLQWLTTLLAPQGYLIVGEPADLLVLDSLPQAFAEIGVAQTTDARIITDDWTWRLTRWQMRPGASSRQAGFLQQYSQADLNASPTLQRALITTYREVFGGDEWAEWMRCQVCKRQYSQREYEELSPADRCICGAERSLELFHSPEYVMAQVASDLADPSSSRLYARTQTDRDGGQPTIDAFIWGYLATPEHMAHALLPRQGSAEQQRFKESLADYMTSAGVEATAPIYHQAFIGALSGSRNFGLVRAMFTRVCQFAWDHHAPIFVTATIPSVNAYPLLRGIGMEVIYTYPTMPAPPLLHHVGAASDASEVVLAPSRLDEQGVILAGSVWPILSLISSASDRKLEVLVARKLRQLIA